MPYSIIFLYRRGIIMVIECENNRNEINNTDKFLQDINNELRARPGVKGPIFNEAMRNMTEEQRQSAYEVEKLRYSINEAIGGYFDDAIAGCKSMLLLAAIPKMLTSVHILCSNTAMRIIVSDDVSKYRTEAIKLIKENFSHQVFKSVGLIRLFNKLDDSGADNLAECYWLYMLCKHLNCVNPEFEKILEKALLILEDVEELEFFEHFDQKNVRHRALKKHSAAQYIELWQLLKKL